MRRLHCNSTIMGQHCWWLKLIFYVLDVGTANSLVLYREAMNNKDTKHLSVVVDFKVRLVHSVIGDIPEASISKKDETHKLIRYDIQVRLVSVVSGVHSCPKIEEPDSFAPICVLSVQKSS